MRIAIDMRAMDSGIHGGVSEFILNLLPELFAARQKHSFVLFSNSRRGGQFKDLQGFSNVRFVHTNYPNKFFTFSCRFLHHPKIDALLDGADVLFSPHFLPAPVSNAAKRVTVFHDISFEYFPHFFDFKRRLWHKYISPRKQAHLSDHIIVPSSVTKNDLTETYGINENKISIIPWGVAPIFFERNANGFNAIKRKYKLPERYILSLGTIEPRKNFTALILAFNLLKKDKRFSDAKLVIAGPKGWSYKDTLCQIQLSPYKQDIFLPGSIARKDRPYLYQHADIFVFPSFYEGFGFPPLEAMASGVPTLVSLFSSLPELTTDAALFIDPYRPNEIAQVMAEVLRDPKLKEKLVYNGLAQAQKFQWDRAAQNILDILESV